jgi:ATP-dependent protease ClpP protease subunit
VNPFLRKPSAFRKTPLRAEQPEPKTAEGGVVTLRMYDPIDSWGGTWGLSAKEFVTTLDALPDDTTEIRLMISSPGGEVWEALAILNSLRQHPAKVTAVIEGIAASSASFIAAAADECLIMQNAEVFVHNAWGLTVGNAEDMQKMAGDLVHEDRNIASIYAAKAGGTVDEWLAAMAAETWYSAEEAVAAGLADRVIDGGREDAAAQARNRFDLSVFASRPRPQDPPPPPAASGATPGPKPPPHSPATTSVSGSTENPEESMTLTDAQVTDLRTRLGITDENADGDTILAALDEVLAEQTPTETSDAELSPAALAEVTRLSTELAELKAQAATRTKNEHFAAWLRDGKTSPAERAQLEAMYDAAPAQTVALVDARAKGSVVPVDAIGHGEDTAATDEDRLFAELFGATVKGA